MTKSNKNDTTEATKGKECTSEELAFIAEHKNKLQTKLDPLKFEGKTVKGDVSLILNVDERRIDLFNATVAKMSGVANADFGIDIIKRTIFATMNNSPRAGKVEDQANTVSAAMMELAPRDGIEGMLISQMVALYNHAMECLRMATIPSNKESIQGHLTLHNQTTKLMRTYIAQMEALKKYRTGGQQKVIVEHVHVTDGGQAIIGNVIKGGGGGKIEN